MKKLKPRGSKIFLDAIQIKAEARREREEKMKSARLERLERQKAFNERIKGKQKMKIWSPNHRLHGQSCFIVDDTNAPVLIVVRDWYRSEDIVISQDAVIPLDEYECREAARIKKIEADFIPVGRNRGISRVVTPIICAAAALEMHNNKRR